MELFCIVGGGLAAMAAGPALLAAPGFTAAGVTAWSAAAVVQSSIGNVAVGSAFATLQSAGAAGLAASTTAALGAAGAAGGAALCAAAECAV